MLNTPIHFNFKDLSEHTYGELTVIKLAGKSRSGNYTWLCECSCGKTPIVAGGNLRFGNTISCGCLRSERIKWTNYKGGISADLVYFNYKSMGGCSNWVSSV